MPRTAERISLWRGLVYSCISWERLDATIRKLSLLILLLASVLGATSAEAGSGIYPFISRTDDQAWSDYQVIIWQDQTPLRLAGLARLGVTAGRIFGSRGVLDLAQIPRDVAAFRAQNLRWYIENIATDFYAPYHRWQPDRSVTWLFDQVKTLYSHDPSDRAAFVRTPSLSDRVWLRRMKLRLQQHVRAFKLYRPLYYNLADEAGIADLAAAWDFDLAPASLAGMRIWLKRRYGSLAALNREWGTRFVRWSAVMPRSTDAALSQSGQNFSAWGDFKAWMDVAFARAVHAGAVAVHAADPRARAALEGAQPPGWGGYNYSYLAKSVDVLEMYDADNNVEIVRSLAPNVVTLSTTDLSAPEQVHSVWHELLLGERGLILWDPDNAFVDDSGRPTQRGRTLGALIADLRSGLAAQLIASTPTSDPIGILYSPASFRTQWLLDRKNDGVVWTERGSEAEDVDSENAVRATTQRAAGMLTHLGVQPRWLTARMIEKGVLEERHIRVLILPHAIALSLAELRRIRAFVKGGGVVLTDTDPGLFDQHSRRRDRAPLANLTGPGRPITLLDMLQEKLEPGSSAPLARLQRVLKRGGVSSHFAISTQDGSPATDVDVRAFRNGASTIIGLQRDWNASSKVEIEDVVLGFKKPVNIYDLRQHRPVQHAAKVTVRLNSVEPALIVVTPVPLPGLAISGSTKARLGSTAYLTIAQPGPILTDNRIAHVEAIAPDGSSIEGDTANLALRGPRITWRAPLKLTDPTGEWTIRVTDVLGSGEIEHKLVVQNSISAPSSR